MTDQPHPHCEDCRWWQELSGSRGYQGYCKANPPVCSSESPAGVWPVTPAGEWCGRFSAKPKQRDTQPRGDLVRS